MHPFDIMNVVLGCKDYTEFFGLIKKGGINFWETIPLFPWSKHLYNSFKDPIILTAAPWSGTEETAYGKISWVRNHFGDEAVKRTIICPSKLKCHLANENTILIDDLNTNIDEWIEAGEHAIRFPSFQFDGRNPTRRS